MDNYLDQFEQDIQEKPIDWREIFETLLKEILKLLYIGIC